MNDIRYKSSEWRLTCQLLVHVNRCIFTASNILYLILGPTAVEKLPYKKLRPLKQQCSPLLGEHTPADGTTPTSVSQSASWEELLGFQARAQMFRPLSCRCLEEHGDGSHDECADHHNNAIY